MAKLTMPAETARALSTAERVTLFCAASGTDWEDVKISVQVVRDMVVKGLIERGARGPLSLTDRGRAVLRTMLPEL
jgi:hypothetical protein